MKREREENHQDEHSTQDEHKQAKTNALPDKETTDDLIILREADLLNQACIAFTSRHENSRTLAQAVVSLNETLASIGTDPAVLFQVIEQLQDCADPAPIITQFIRLMTYWGPGEGEHQQPLSVIKALTILQEQGILTPENSDYLMRTLVPKRLATCLSLLLFQSQNFKLEYTDVIFVSQYPKDLLTSIVYLDNEKLMKKPISTYIMEEENAHFCVVIAILFQLLTQKLQWKASTTLTFIKSHYSILTPLTLNCKTLNDHNLFDEENLTLLITWNKTWVKKSKWPIKLLDGFLKLSCRFNPNFKLLDLVNKTEHLHVMLAAFQMLSACNLNNQDTFFEILDNPNEALFYANKLMLDNQDNNTHRYRYQRSAAEFSSIRTAARCLAIVNRTRNDKEQKSPSKILGKDMLIKIASYCGKHGFFPEHISRTIAERFFCKPDVSEKAVLKIIK